MGNSVTRDHHNLRRNLNLNNKFISNDGGDEGISVGNTGHVIITGTGTSALVIRESTETPSAGGLSTYGYLWVLDNAPNDLYFTNDAGNDIQITSGAGTVSTPDDTLTVGDAQVNIATSVVTLFLKVQLLVLMSF